MSKGEMTPEKRFFSFSQRGCWENHIASAPTLHKHLTRWQLVVYNSVPVKKTTFHVCQLTAALFPLLLPPAAVFLSAGRAVRGGGARPQAAGAPGLGGEEEPAAEGACSEGEALPEECPQGCAQGRAGGAGAAREAEGCRAEGGASPQRHNAGGASTRTLCKHGNTPANATITNPTSPNLPPTWTENWLVESERLLGGFYVRDKQIATVTSE